MKAKDTVIRDFDKTRAYYPGEVEVKLEIQAEITWDKAIGEVVKWVDEHVYWRKDAPYKSTIDPEEWQNQKKDWGIK